MFDTLLLVGVYGFKVVTVWHGVDHPPPSRAKDKHEQSCTYTSSLLPPIPCDEFMMLDAVQKVASLIYFTCD